MTNIDSRYEMTLDPPGRIAIIGAGPLGIEAALYGRFLGYEVVVFEQGEIGQSLRDVGDVPLPMLPDRCLSPLAVSALKAQDGGLTFPLTVKQWIERGLIRIAATDLLVDRVRTHCEVTAIELISEVADAYEEDDESYIDGDVPPDFRLTVQDHAGTRSVEAESVIVAIGSKSIETSVGLAGLRNTPYLFRIGESIEGTDEERLHRGWHEIVLIYAGLGGRQSLDLYRPLRT